MSGSLAVVIQCFGLAMLGTVQFDGDLSVVTEEIHDIVCKDLLRTKARIAIPEKIVSSLVMFFRRKLAFPIKVWFLP